jgi:hypothetical protein
VNEIIDEQKRRKETHRMCEDALRIIVEQEDSDKHRQPTPTPTLDCIKGWSTFMLPVLLLYNITHRNVPSSNLINLISLFYTTPKLT